jgi:trk system potassium uptake protein TrkA
MKVFIVGVGEVGFHIARSLSEEGHDLVVIELDPEKVQRLQSELDVLAVTGDGCDPAILQEHGVEDADLFFAVSDNDPTNLLVALTARSMGAKRCVARLGDPYHGSNPLLQADPEIIPLYPERLVAEEILGLTRVPGATKAHFFADDKLVLLHARPSMSVDIYGKPLRQLQGPDGWILVGVLQGLRLTVPRGDTILMPGQEIYAVGHTETAKEFLRAIGVESTPPRNVVIAGAGHVGHWLAKRLVEQKIQVTVIERQQKKALSLASEAADALVLRGDATNPELLREAGAQHADYFVAATQADEANAISSFLARELGARLVVTLYQRPEFLNVLRAARVDIALSPRLVTAGTILRTIHPREILSLDLIETGDAEVVEFAVPANCKVIHDPLRKLKFPEGSIVGAVMRGDERHVPGGDFTFQPGDRALVFTLANALPALEKMFRAK